MNFYHELLEIYRKFPCRTLPNAFWKTGEQGDVLRVVIRCDPEGDLAALAVWQENQLLAFWCGTPMDSPLTDREIEQVRFALVHKDALPVFADQQFSLREPYFRLIHKGEVPVYNCPPHYHFADVVPEKEDGAVVELIRSCYQNINVDESIVRGWMAHPTYDPELWVWVKEIETGKRVGLGIAELDSSVPEASLEWVQVLPKEKRKGFGKAITNELLRRIAGRVTFTTVSGKVNNRSRPEQLYRNCGFSGDDVWWLLQKDN